MYPTNFSIFVGCNADYEIKLYVFKMRVLWSSKSRQKIKLSSKSRHPARFGWKNVSLSTWVSCSLLLSHILHTSQSVTDVCIHRQAKSHPTCTHEQLTPPHLPPRPKNFARTPNKPNSMYNFQKICTNPILGFVHELFSWVKWNKLMAIV